jgi:prepilin-type N-terminal cleavage/methylation domain-containing protein
MPTYKAGNRRGVTLLEMLIVVAIVATIASISFPALTAGLAGIRLSSASGSVASFLTSAMNNVERHEQPAAIVVTPKENMLAVYTADSVDHPRDKMTMPQGISIEGDESRRFVLFPGGAFPKITIVLKSEKGARKTIEIDPITAVPKIK